MAATPEALAAMMPPLERAWADPIMRAIVTSGELAEQSGLADTPEGKSILKFALAGATLLRRLLRDPEMIAELLDIVPGGDPTNPHYVLDLLPGAVAQRIWQGTPFADKTLMFLEEHGFVALGRRRKIRYVIADPLDESSLVETGLRVQTSGAVICNERGECLAGAITSLVDNTILFVTKDHPPRLLNFDESRGRLHEFQAEGTSNRTNRLRYQTLPRRIDIMPKKFVDIYNYPSIPTMGGYAVLMLALGKQDFALDHIGQEVYEAAIWYTIAQACGFPVTSLDGKPIDMPAHIRYAMRRRDMSQRIPAVISRTSEIHRRVIPIFQNPDAVIQN